MAARADGLLPRIFLWDIPKIGRNRIGTGIGTGAGTGVWNPGSGFRDPGSGIRDPGFRDLPRRVVLRGIPRNRVRTGSAAEGSTSWYSTRPPAAEVVLGGIPNNRVRTGSEPFDSSGF